MQMVLLEILRFFCAVIYYHHHMFKGLNKEIMATLKDCSPEMVKTLALASEMCSGTSEYKKTADYGHA